MEGSFSGFLNNVELCDRSPGTPYYYGTEKATFEQDFLIQKEAAIIPIEVKAETNIRSVSKKQMLSACAGRWLNWISVTPCIRCLARYCSFVERRTLQTKKLRKNFANI